MATKLDDVQKARDYAKRHAINVPQYGNCLTTIDTSGYLALRGARREVISAGIQVYAYGVPLGLVRPIFHNDIGWLYPVGDIEKVLGINGEQAEP